MILESEKFVKKYAFFYTLAIAIILIAPLIVYISLLLKIDYAKVNLDLQKKAEDIVVLMDDYSNKQGEVYNFPRYQEYQAGLYRDDFTAIFTLIEDKKEIKHHTMGFHRDGGFYYFIYPLQKGYYFGASYLIVSKEYTPAKIYLFAAVIFTSIMVILFFFSRSVLKNFSRPFEKMNRHLDSFIRDSMHEINTPLSIINLNIDLFSRKHGEDRHLKRIKVASKTLSTIYDDMDYLIKHENAKFVKRTFNFSQFLQNRIDYFEEIAGQKKIKIVANLEHDIELYFSKTKLQRVIDNTLSNAIKYSYDEKDIIITLFQKQKKIHFTVQDFGVGIEDVDKIFQRYHRENFSRGGFGIGLDIVKKIVDHEGIVMSIKSKIKKGTTFSYIFT